jgi:hypothetical protein
MNGKAERATSLINPRTAPAFATLMVCSSSDLIDTRAPASVLNLLNASLLEI